MDLIDKKILCELDSDCRTPLSRIAKKLRIGRNIVDYRMKKMEDEGIIERYISTINLGLLGYKTYKIFFRVYQSQNQEKFVNYLIKHNNVIHLVKTEGHFDYTISVATRSIKELDEIIGEIRSNFKELIKEHYINIMVFTKIYKLSKLLLGKKENLIKSESYSEKEKESNLDEKDKKILKELSQFANINIIDLARKTNLSLDVVKYRLKNLKKEIIKVNRGIFNFSKLGYYHYVVMVKMDNPTKKDETDFDSWCLQKQNIIYYAKKIGEFDYEINAAITDINDLNSFLGELRNKFGDLIDSYELFINTKLLKLNYVTF
jgi:Lrp/AsnC family transcriptional regulator, leucine-responsive regulatory protein